MTELKRYGDCEREREREMHIERGGQTGREINSYKKKEGERKRGRKSERKTIRQRERETKRDRQRECDTETAG